VEGEKEDGGPIGDIRIHLGTGTRGGGEGRRKTFSLRRRHGRWATSGVTKKKTPLRIGKKKGR